VIFVKPGPDVAEKPASFDAEKPLGQKLGFLPKTTSITLVIGQSLVIPPLQPGVIRCLGQIPCKRRDECKDAHSSA